MFGKGPAQVHKYTAPHTHALVSVVPCDLLLLETSPCKKQEKKHKNRQPGSPFQLGEPASGVKAVQLGQCSHRAHNGLSTHLPAQSCGSHQAVKKLLPKASGGFSRASGASMGIVFLPPQWPNRRCVCAWRGKEGGKERAGVRVVVVGGGVLSSYPAPFLLSPCSALAGAAQGRDRREKAHAFTSASHAHKEKKNQIAQTCTHAHTHV